MHLKWLFHVLRVPHLMCTLNLITYFEYSHNFAEEFTAHDYFLLRAIACYDLQKGAGVICGKTSRKKSFQTSKQEYV